MRGIVYGWGRLEPIPGSATNLKVSTTGNMFTRRFDVDFHAPKNVIDDWIAKSEGPKEAKPERLSPNQVKFRNSAGGKAHHAEVIVD